MGKSFQERVAIAHAKRNPRPMSDVQAQIQRLAADSPPPPLVPGVDYSQSLPGMNAAQVELVTLTLDELWDLIYQSTSTQAQRSNVTRGRAQALANRAAGMGVLLARSHDGIRLGPDPRPGKRKRP